MKTIKELLANKQLRVKRDFILNIERIKEKYTNKLQPHYFDLFNKIEFRQFDNILEISCRNFVIFCFDKKEIEDIAVLSKSCTSEYIEKINRYKVTATDYKFTINLDNFKKPSEAGIMEFRSKDYTFLKEGSDTKSYGNHIKTENLILDTDKKIVGLLIKTFYENDLFYTFIN